jgi:hypothetical protein
MMYLTYAKYQLETLCILGHKKVTIFLVRNFALFTTSDHHFYRFWTISNTRYFEFRFHMLIKYIVAYI